LQQAPVFAVCGGRDFVAGKSVVKQDQMTLQRDMQAGRRRSTSYLPLILLWPGCDDRASRELQQLFGWEAADAP
jgi:hypothetical protein